MYEKFVEPTQPGTDMNVTPDKDAPIIPYATTNHGEALLPIKKARLLAFLAVSQVT
jgi:hypothetical protein